MSFQQKPHPLSGIAKTLGPDVLAKIQQSKILLVGAGGIGCELLKNLALSGFHDVEVIDLDTVDVSNLNRQFLFRSRHVGMAKCEVACEAALKMVPPVAVLTVGEDDTNDEKKEKKTNVSEPAGTKKSNADTTAAAAAAATASARYTPHHGNVCDNSRFNVPYISKFDVVLNALDNVAARRRVNRLCLAASVPLVEAGTTGYLGQVTVIDAKSNVECYECQPKPTQKVYPICTIRSTPSMPVHTIVWAKELYKLIFGPNVDDSMLFEDTETDEPSVYMDVVIKLRSFLISENSNENKSTNGDGKSDELEEKIRAAAREVLTVLYVKEIEKQIATGRYETARRMPVPLGLSSIQSGISIENRNPPTKQLSYKQTDVWSVEDCVSEFTSCLLDAVKGTSSPPLPEFDKDDTLSMRFVTATSNLRSYVFGIEPIQSYYSAKGIAGNIIPAIATTNAIVAGLQVLQVFHILRARLTEQNSSSKNNEEEEEEDTGKATSLKNVCKYIYCNRDKTRKGYYLLPTALPDPNPDCFVCRNATIPLTLTISKWTLRNLLTRVIKKELGFEQPTLWLGEDIIHEEGDGADAEMYECNLDKTLEKLPCGGIQHGTIVRIEDFTQNLEVDVCISHRDKWDDTDEADESGQGGKMINGERGEEAEKFLIGGGKPRVTPSVSKAVMEENSSSVTNNVVSNVSTNNSSEKKDGDDDDDVIVIMDESPENTQASMNGTTKRSVDEMSNGDMNGGHKRRKIGSPTEVAAKNAKENKTMEIIELD